MTPQTVRFTGLEISGADLLNLGRKRQGLIPANWTRFSFVLQDLSVEPLSHIDRWISENIDGPWASYSVPDGSGKRRVVLAFECDMDAVMFRLKQGETAWKTD